MRRPDVDRLRQWVDELGQSGGLGSPLSLRNFGPGVWVDPGAGLAEPLKIPPGYEINIRRKQGEPAMVTVKHGSDTWTVSENNVEELPEEVRPVVKQMLAGRMLGGFENRLAPGDMSFFDERFDLMNERMEKLMEEMRGMRDEGLRLREGE